MRLTMIQSRYVKATTNRLEARLESTSHGCRNQRHWAVESRPSRVAARPHGHDPGADGLLAGRGTGVGASLAATVSPARADALPTPQEVGWTASGVAELGRGRSVPDSLGRTSPAGGSAGGVSAAGRTGGEVGPEDRPLGRVPSLGAAGVAQSRTRYAAPEKRSSGASGVEKNSPKRWQPC